MKNAMKKLMAFALVAVMLIGALPFGASAAEDPGISATLKVVAGTTVISEVTLAYGTHYSGDVNEAGNYVVTAAQVERIMKAASDVIPADEDYAYAFQSLTTESGNPVTQVANGWKFVANYTKTARSASCAAGCGFTGLPSVVKAHQDNGEHLDKTCRTCGNSYAWGTTCPCESRDEVSVPVHIYVDNVHKESKTIKVTAAGITLNENYAKQLAGSGYDFIKWTNKSGASTTGNNLTASYLKGVITETTYELYLYMTEAEDTTPPAQNPPAQNPPAQNPSNPTVWVDVILNEKTSGFVTGDFYTCKLSGGKITQADRDAVAAEIAGKNIVAWKRGDTQEVQNTLLNFDFSALTYPINVYPVFGTTSSNTGSNSGTNSGNNNSSYNKFPYNVYLNIYNDTKLGSAEKVIKINDTAAEDGKVTLGEVKTIVKNYYNAIDTDKGIVYDGLYLAMGNWSNDYIWDNKDSVIDDVDELRNQSTVYINVMIDNAKLAGSSTADSSNPKTGDNIFVAVSVMTVAASALAVAFYLNKKRAV